MLTRLLLLAATSCLLAAPTVPAVERGEKTQTLIAVLRSDAPLYEKARACQQLGEIGTPAAVPALAGLLSDPQLSAYARSGLEGIPGPDAAAALRDAARHLRGSLLAGVVNSLGVLRDPQAVEVLRPLAADPGSGVASEALLALGNIATPAAVHCLKQALSSRLDLTRSQAAGACLLAAERQRTGGDLKRAAELYDLVRKAKVPPAYRVGATRGAILSRTTGRVPFLIAQLKSKDTCIRNAALLTAREIPDAALANALNTETARATPELQRQLLLALADCHNPQSIAVIRALGDSPNPELRKTALTVLGRIGPAAATALVGALQEDRPMEEKTIVLSGLRTMEGAAVDELLLGALDTSSAPGLQVDLIHLLDDRDVTQASPDLLKQATAWDRAVRIAALSALRSLASARELPALIAIARSHNDEGVGAAAENALVGVCNRAGDSAAEAVLNELKQGRTSTERNCWVRVLGRVAYTNALPQIQAAADDPEAAVAANALEQLGGWPNPAPMECLLKAMISGRSPELRQRALASVIELATTAADESQAPAPAIVGWLECANRAAQTAETKRRLLGLLGRLRTVASFRLLAPYLEDAKLRMEAASGVIRMAPALAQSEAAGELRAALENIAVTVSNADLRARAAQLAKTIPAPSK